MNNTELRIGNNVVSSGQPDWDPEIVIEQVWTELEGEVTRSTIRAVLTEVIHKYEHAPIQTFVPIFIRRETVERARALR